ncbi:MAG: hypothetical protein NC191_02490 [Muribaculaceae bacterium]|nr:hypothetical protein [Muribaculaceae bacterium]
MYILELIIRAFKKKSASKPIPVFELQDSNIENLGEDDCEHLFLPLDSSNQLFACKYCGLVVPKEKLKNKNIFENKRI